MSGPLRVMVRLGRFAPPVLRGFFRLNLRAMRGGGQRGHERMAASFPEPDRSLLQRPEVRDGFMACFQESCRQSARGPVWDVGLMTRPWGFDLAAIKVTGAAVARRARPQRSRGPWPLSRRRHPDLPGHVLPGRGASVPSPQPSTRDPERAGRLTNAGSPCDPHPSTGSTGAAHGAAAPIPASPKLVIAVALFLIGGNSVRQSMTVQPPAAAVNVASGARWWRTPRGDLGSGCGGSSLVVGHSMPPVAVRAGICQ